MIRHTLGCRLYPRTLNSRAEKIGLDPTAYSIHTSRRAKNIRAVQLRLGHTKLERVVRVFGIEVEGALELPEQLEI